MFTLPAVLGAAVFLLLMALGVADLTAFAVAIIVGIIVLVVHGDE